MQLPTYFIGNVSSVTDGSGHVAYYSYDLQGRVSCIKDSDKATLLQYTYDSQGNPVRTVDSYGTVMPKRLPSLDLTKKAPSLIPMMKTAT
ncbi:MAG: RHS repeat protein [Lachnospiraceae bacterium]|nr:RHS repeat protein [Lachnospiraceae bacterium]